MLEESKPYIQMCNEFIEKYNKIVRPLLQKYENPRKIRLKALMFLSGILTIFAFALFIRICISEDIVSAIIFAPFIFYLLYFLLYFLWSHVKKNFEKEIKKEIIPILCDYFNDAKWSYGKYSDTKIFFDSYIIPYQVSEKYGSIFKGSYKDIKFEIIEAEYVYCRAIANACFNGIIFKFDISNCFASHTVINPLNIFVPSMGFYEIKLENIQCNEDFTIYTNSEVDAKRIITLEFLEILKKMKDVYNASKFKCAFYNNSVIIALNTNKNLFSLCSLIKPIDDKNQYCQMYEEIESVIKLIDYLKNLLNS